ncbi:MAG TPA: AI-2E family transporter [Candidatus Paceibacterota bacterium]
MNQHEAKVVITSGTIVKALAIFALAWGLFYLRDVVLILLTAIVIASAIEPMAKWLVKHKIPRVPAVIAIYLIAAIVIGGVLLLFMPPLVDEVSRLANDLPGYIEKYQSGQSGVEVLTTGDVTSRILESQSFSQIIAKVQTVLSGFSSGIFQTISFIFGGLLGFVLIIVISFYLAVQERGIENFLRIVIPLKYEKYSISLWRRSQEKIGKWLQGQLVLALIIGVLVFLGLTILGVKYAFLLAVLAAIFELIPIFGPILAAVPAIILGFTDSATLGFMVIGLYVIIQQFENHLIYPLVVTKIVGVPPLLVILALFAGAKLAGFLGLLLAIPIAAVLVEIFHDVEIEKLANMRSRDEASEA